MRCFSDIGRIAGGPSAKGRPRVMDEDDLVLIRRSFDDLWPSSRHWPRFFTIAYSSTPRKPGFSSKAGSIASVHGC